MNTMKTGVISVKITGGDKTVKNMSAFAKRVQEQVFIRAVQPALKDMADAAKRNVMATSSVSAGSTRTRAAIASRISIKLQRAKGSRYFSKGRLAVFYGKPRGNAPKQEVGKPQPLWVRASLAHLIEYGFKLTHFFGRKVRAQRIAERPFMRPAFDKHKKSAEAKFLSVINSEVRRVTP